MSEAVIAATAAAPRETGIDFERLYKSSRDDVYAYAISLLRERAAAEDVTATAFERAYRKRSRFKPSKGTPRSWLFGIARNAALDELRRRSRHTELTEEPIDNAGLTSHGTDESNERRLVIAAGLTQLDARERELIALKFFAGLSNAEIARVLGISESNTGTKLHRTVTKLRGACNGAL